MLHLLRLRLLPFCGGAACLWLAAGVPLPAAGAPPPAASQTPPPDRYSLSLSGTETPTPSPLLPSAATPPGQGYQPPKVLKRGTVAYPILANLNRIEGIVGIHFVIDETGKVTNATVSKSSRSLTLDAVVKSHGMLEWTFQPAMLNGKPVPSTFDQDIEFRLDPNEQREFALKRLAAPIGMPDPPYPTEALAMHPRPHGDCTIGVFWTSTGLVDIINLVKSSGSATLDHAALRFAYQNWRIDPKEIKDPKAQYTRVLTLTPPDDGTDTGTGTPPPLASATPTPTPTPSPTPRPKHSH